MRRVVITGLGLLSPLGCGVEVSWQRLTAGQNAARRVENFDVSDLTCQIACQIPRGDGSDGTFNPNDWMEPKEQRKVDPFIIYAMAASKQALDDAGWHPQQRVGDIELSAVVERCSAYTPVPGGVGPMTIAMLIAQTVDAAEKASASNRID